jgi:chemotaxis protein CheX
MEQQFDRDKLIDMARRATTDVFGTMLGMEVNSLEAYVEAEPPPASQGVLALIGFAGTWIGTGSIYCSSTMACRIADNMLMATHSAVEEEVLDAIAEVTNMILGNVKTELEETLGPMLLSIPTVLYGRNFIKRSLGKREWVVVPFDCGDERFEVQICMAPNHSHDVMRPGFQRPYGVNV